MDRPLCSITFPAKILLQPSITSTSSPCMIVPGEDQHPCTCHKPSSVVDKTTSSPPPPTKTTDNGLSSGAIAAIMLSILSVMILSVIVIAAVVCCIHKRKKVKVSYIIRFVTESTLCFNHCLQTYEVQQSGNGSQLQVASSAS